MKRERYLQKQGNSYWKTTDESGDAQIIGREADRRCGRASWKGRT